MVAHGFWKSKRLSWYDLPYCSSFPLWHRQLLLSTRSVCLVAIGTAVQEYLA